MPRIEDCIGKLFHIAQHKGSSPENDEGEPFLERMQSFKKFSLHLRDADIRTRMCLPGVRHMLAHAGNDMIGAGGEPYRIPDRALIVRKQLCGTSVGT